MSAVAAPNLGRRDADCPKQCLSKCRKECIWLGKGQVFIENPAKSHTAPESKVKSIPTWVEVGLVSCKSKPEKVLEIWKRKEKIGYEYRHEITESWEYRAILRSTEKKSNMEDLTGLPAFFGILLRLVAAKKKVKSLSHSSFRCLQPSTSSRKVVLQFTSEIKRCGTFVKLVRQGPKNMSSFGENPQVVRASDPIWG